MTLPLLETAIAQTLAYADVFDYPMTAEEVHRYLIRARASVGEVSGALQAAVAQGDWLTCSGPFFVLRARESLIETRLARSEVSARLWPAALEYGYRMARLPFVRMVAVTGSLARANVGERRDIDYFIVTQAGRLWICRAMLVLLTRVPAALSGFKICLNYLVTLSAEALVFPEQNLYAAHEVAQMVPLQGLAVYDLIRQRNQWVMGYLPNAWGQPTYPLARSFSPTADRRAALAGGKDGREQPAPFLSRSVESILSGHAWDRLETWEMRRKVRRLIASRGESTEASFNEAVCKGHFDGHQEKTLAAYEARLARVLNTNVAVTSRATAI
jgi:hypothetical protein